MVQTISRYKITVSPPGDTDPPTAPIYTVDDMIGINPPFQLAPQIITVFQFLTADERADVIARTLALDVTAHVQDAIDYVGNNNGTKPIGILWFPAGSYRIEGTLTCTQPITLWGAGQGDADTGVAPTILAWFGNTDPLLQFGGDTAAPIFGGGIRSMLLDGNALCNNALEIFGCQHSDFRDLGVRDAKAAAIFCYNRVSQGFGTDFLDWTNIHVNLRSGSTQTATGMWFDRLAGNTQRIGLHRLRNITINHANGPGVRIVDAGDGFVWDGLFTFRNTGETGVGVDFTSISPTAEVNNHLFLNPSVTGGFVFRTAGLHDGTRIVNANMSDRNTDLTAAAYISGDGASEVSVTGTDGRLGGQDKTLGYSQTVHHDGMKFQFFSTPLVGTADGTWNTTATAVIDAAQPGGALKISTAVSSGNVASLYDAAAIGTSGVIVDQQPAMVFVVAPIDSGNAAVSRCGLMDSLSDPPTNGIYVELDPAADATNYRCITRAASNSTVLATTVAFSTDPRQWRIEVRLDSASFWTRASPYDLWTFVGTSTTNIPADTVKLDHVYQVIARDAAARSIFIYDHRDGYNTEV